MEDTERQHGNGSLKRKRDQASAKDDDRQSGDDTNDYDDHQKKRMELHDRGDYVSPTAEEYNSITKVYDSDEDSTKVTLRAIDEYTRVFIFKDTMLDMGTARIRENMADTHVKSLEDVLGLDGAKDLLHQLIVAPTVNPEIFQGLCAPGNYAGIIGLRGVGKKTLMRAFCKRHGKNLIEVGKSYTADGFVDNLLNAAELLRPCVIYFNHIDHCLLSNEMTPNSIGRQIGHFYPWHEQRGRTSDVWMVFGTKETPNCFHEYIMDRIGPNYVYAEPPDEASRSVFIHSLCEEMWGPQRWVGPTYAEFIIHKIIKLGSVDCTYLEILKYFTGMYQKRVRDLVRKGVYKGLKRHDKMLLPAPEDIQNYALNLDWKKRICNRDIQKSTAKYATFMGISEALKANNKK